MFNLRSIGLVLGLCVLLVASRWIMVAYAEPTEKWIGGGLKFLRQNAISDITMLAALAFAQALGASRYWSRAQSFCVGILTGLAPLPRGGRIDVSVVRDGAARRCCRHWLRLWPRRQRWQRRGPG